MTMLSILIEEADKKQLPIALNHEQMLKFLVNFERLRERELRLIAEGFPEKHTCGGTQMYASLIKTLVERSSEDTTEEFKRYKTKFIESLNSKDTLMRSKNPTLFFKKVVKRDNETQTELMVRRRQTQTDSLPVTD